MTLRGLRYKRPRVIRPEAQLSDPISWDILSISYKLVHGGRIDGVRVQLSPKLWTLEGKLPLSPDVNGFRETGDPESGPAQISFCLRQSRLGPLISWA